MRRRRRPRRHSKSGITRMNTDSHGWDKGDWHSRAFSPGGHSRRGASVVVRVHPCWKKRLKGILRQSCGYSPHRFDGRGQQAISKWTYPQANWGPRVKISISSILRRRPQTVDGLSPSFWRSQQVDVWRYRVTKSFFIWHPLHGAVRPATLVQFF
jgi:hypothetical protein